MHPTYPSSDREVVTPGRLAVVPSGCVLEDVKRNYGEEPTEVVTIGIDSNDTKARAESYMGAIVFRKP